VVGCLAAVVNGLIWPGFNYAFSQILNLFPRVREDLDARTKINNYCLLFLGVAFIGAFTSALYSFCFGVAS
jgi:hypothetical protein